MSGLAGGFEPGESGIHESVSEHPTPRNARAVANRSIRALLPLDGGFAQALAAVERRHPITTVVLTVLLVFGSLGTLLGAYGLTLSTGPFCNDVLMRPDDVCHLAKGKPPSITVDTYDYTEGLVRAQRLRIGMFFGPATLTAFSLWALVSALRARPRPLPLDTTDLTTSRNTVSWHGSVDPFAQPLLVGVGAAAMSIAAIVPFVASGPDQMPGTIMSAVLAIAAAFLLMIGWPRVGELIRIDDDGILFLRGRGTRHVLPWSDITRVHLTESHRAHWSVTSATHGTIHFYRGYTCMEVLGRRLAERSAEANNAPHFRYQIDRPGF